MAEKKLEIAFDTLDKILIDFKKYFEQLEECMLTGEINYSILLSFCNDMLSQMENMAYANIELAEGIPSSNKTSLLEEAQIRYNKIKDYHNAFIIETAKLITEEEVGIKR